MRMPVSEKNIDRSALKRFIKQNADLWWHIPEEKKQNLPVEIILEYVLNYGNEKIINRLFKIISIQEAAKIFFAQTTNRKRVNYHPRTLNYFTLYFKKHAS